jgi:predicted small metal-binding protein
MKSLACRELGTDCSYVATGNTVDEVKKAGLSHVRVAHPDLLKSMSTPEQMAKMDKQLEKLIKTTA